MNQTSLTQATDARLRAAGDQFSNPTVTVVVPVHNGANTVLDSIASVLTQSVSRLEVVAVDDGSSDGTGALLAAVSDSRVRSVVIQHSGVSAARNAGVRASRGKYLAFLDADDLALEGWLKTLLGLADTPGTGVACCGVREVDSMSEQASDVRPTRNHPLMATASEALFLAGSFILPKTVFEEAGGYDECLRFSENTELGIRVTQVCDQRGLGIRSTNEPLVLVRRSRRAQGSHHGIVRSTPRVLRLHRDVFERHRPLLGTWLAAAGVSAARLARYRTSKVFLRASLRANPRSIRSWARLLVVCLPGVRRLVWKLAEREGACSRLPR
jgi:glycosyltransferase involved in cell wall biosynthesis